MSDLPAVPAVSSFDPVEWTKKIDGLSKRINDLEYDKQTLQNENFDLKSKLAKQTSATAAARGLLAPMKEDLEAARAKLQASENLKETERLRAEVAKMHAERARAAREQAIEDKKTKAQLEDLTRRAIRAEGKFQALEGTAAMMAQARDRANDSAAAMLAERDQALQEVQKLRSDLAQAETELRTLRAQAASAKPAAAAQPAKAK